jgi:MFS family permease
MVLSEVLSTTLSVKPWYKALSKTQWKTLVASNFGWMCDGFETYALILTIGIALRQLLAADQFSQIPIYAGSVIAITLAGWALGGVIGGVLTDYFGRKRIMVLSILAYSLTTGLSALSWDWVSFAILRFCVGLAIGSEWVTGAAIISEMWPDRMRGRGVGMMQCGFGLGFFLASFVWLFVSQLGDGSWRYMYLIGILPALSAFFIRRHIPESEKWEKSDQERQSAKEKKDRGDQLGEHDRALNRFTFFDLFVEPISRRRAILAFLMSVATSLGWYGISLWIPQYVASIATHDGLSGQHWAALSGMAFNAAAVIGYVAFGFLSDIFGRKPTTMTFFAMSLLLVPVQFMLTQDLIWLLSIAAVMGFFASGQYTWMSSWAPELFPTRIRATATGFIFNGARLLAAVGPLVSGAMVVALGGYAKATLIVSAIYILGFVCAPFLPETAGKPLPE